MLEPKVIRLAKLTRTRVKRWTVRSNVGTDLRGACGVASAALWRLLRKHGYEARLMCWSEIGAAHCWVELGSYVIDITASQFGYDNIFIIPLEDKECYPEVYWGGGTYRNRKAFREVRGFFVSPDDFRDEIKQLLKDAGT